MEEAISLVAGTANPFIAPNRDFACLLPSRKPVYQYHELVTMVLGASSNLYAFQIEFLFRTGNILESAELACAFRWAVIHLHSCEVS